MILAAALVDATGLRSSHGRRTTWESVEQDPVAGSIRFKPLFDAPMPEFRRLDILSRILVIATEACLPLPQPGADTALVFGTEFGCLAADQRFEASLHRPGFLEPRVFPYTLPSTCLGEIAIRHGLQGPTLCLSHGPGEEHTALAEASALLTSRAATSALVVAGDWAPGHKTRAAALLLGDPGPDTPPFADPADFAVDLLDALATRLPWTN